MSDLHNLALQLSTIAQHYERYSDKVQTTAREYDGLPMQVQAVIGEEVMTDRLIEMLHNVTVTKDLYVTTILRCRSVLLQAAQDIIKGDR